MKNETIVLEGKTYYTVQGAANYVGLSYPSVIAAIERKQIQETTRLGRAILISQEELDRWRFNTRAKRERALSMVKGKAMPYGNTEYSLSLPIHTTHNDEHLSLGTIVAKWDVGRDGSIINYEVEIVVEDDHVSDQNA